MELEIHQVVVSCEVNELELTPDGKDLFRIYQFAAIEYPFSELPLSQNVSPVAQFVQINFLNVAVLIIIGPVVLNPCTSFIELNLDIFALVFSNVILMHFIISVLFMNPNYMRG